MSWVIWWNFFYLSAHKICECPWKRPFEAATFWKPFSGSKPGRSSRNSSTWCFIWAWSIGVTVRCHESPPESCANCASNSTGQPHYRTGSYAVTSAGAFVTIHFTIHFSLIFGQQQQQTTTSLQQFIWKYSWTSFKQPPYIKWPVIKVLK